MDMNRFLGVVTVFVTLYSTQVTAQFGVVQEAMRCVDKLLPCHPYIHSDIPPPPWCCDPMKEIAEKHVTCLCAVFNHPGMLSFISLTKENALNLLNSCGVKHDASLCTKSAAYSSSTGSTTSGSSSVGTAKNAALLSILGFSFISAFIGF
ncbi:unnamed protein product [Microthlaspi erraticum]|uniref:Bifunctional inhibitor/plant lipid transfer protein/seed storage helical domain-containing protein n=1 Tax=Microthlaspi erraticum TaxID=1685480 RepID=A0A6D2JSH0_9BRAS|nr:unnamed protein product [Microthlaspi erraticum]